MGSKLAHKVVPGDHRVTIALSPYHVVQGLKHAIEVCVRAIVKIKLGKSSTHILTGLPFQKECQKQNGRSVTVVSQEQIQEVQRDERRYCGWSLLPECLASLWLL